MGITIKKSVHKKQMVEEVSRNLKKGNGKEWK